MADSIPGGRHLILWSHLRRQSIARGAILALVLTLLLLVAVLLSLSNHVSEASLAGQLLRWSPALLWGMLANIYISVAAIAIGTLAGLVIGSLQLSSQPLVGLLARWYVQTFRNAPMLILIYFATYVFPFEINLGSLHLAFPDWLKVTLGLALPASANVAEIFRGAIASIPSAQWEAANSLAFRRIQILRWVILPQCLRRMLPSWMNLYATITMGTSLASLVGVQDLLDTAQIASTTVNRVDFTVAIYLATLLLFFVYCYPISRFTHYLEKKYAFL
ncbi:polar amino acid transport system permease protein [Herbaspirillum sp. Sphag1AN]|uniref:amino acid ABC transporter permease n=1 Tax=unclassified Herbaspirillum TaxID=2624150 RepID=UPI00161D018F|nr:MULTISPECIES: amino acid ABC transporter permease [unclassified Herbaspirillum]MBB3213209.1 polar amino acid transport system permease protein [Herbaspirillum sp. Sphag1AN]MBB3246406.1 polar amino acid transport system permease protein [Herbaspirillum sp. Sphag64]